MVLSPIHSPICIYLYINIYYIVCVCVCMVLSPIHSPICIYLHINIYYICVCVCVYGSVSYSLYPGHEKSVSLNLFFNKMSTIVAPKFC